MAIIGAGNMGSLIASQVISQHVFQAKDVLVTGHNEEKLHALQLQGAGIEAENRNASAKSDIILLAVKPKDVFSACSDIAEHCTDKLAISIAAGVPIRVISHSLCHARIIRAMPNIAAFVGEAFTALASNRASEADMHVALAIFGSFGKCAFFEEEKLDALTGISGSAPAYFFLLADALAQVAESNGISKKQARLIAVQTMFGAAKTAMETEVSLQELVRFVASKKGTTEAGLQLADELNLAGIFQQVVERAIARAEEIRKEKEHEIKR